jgi:hypothetical protein
MKLNVNSVAALLVAACMSGTLALAAPPAQSGAKRSAATKAKKAPTPTVEEQIQALRQEFQGQIDGLKNDLATKDSELKKAQQAAADAQASAAKAEEAASAQQQANSDNTAAVDSLKSTVDDMKNVNATVVSSLTDDMSKTAKKSELSDIAIGKFKIGATIFADWSYWSDYDGTTAFIDNQTKPSSTADKRYNTFELTRTYFNLLYTPSDAVSVRVTPDISRNSDGNLYFRLKYGYVDLNKPFAFSKSMKKDKITFGQMQQPLTDWEEGLTGHRYTYKMPMDFSSGLSSSYVGAKVRGPIEFKGKEYLDYDLGVFTNGSYSTTEKSATKQFMGRLTAYPLGTKADRTGFGVTVFGNVGFNNVAPSAAASSQYSIDRSVYMGFYQSHDKAFLLSGQYDLLHNAKGNGINSTGYAFEGNARLGGKTSPLQAFGMYQHYEPNSNQSTNDATKYARTVGGIAYKFNKYFDIALADSNMHYEKAAGLNDANVISIFTQYNF